MRQTLQLVAFAGVDAGKAAVMGLSVMSRKLRAISTDTPEVHRT